MDIDISQKKMTLIEHLEELRKRIIISLISWFIASIGGWYLSIPAISYFKTYSSLKNVQLILIRPTEAFIIRIKVALIIGLLISLPIIIYEILSFVLPGLNKKEKKWVLRLIPGSLILFYGGIAFSIFIMLPISLYFLIINIGKEIAIPQLSLESYVNFLIMITIIGGVIFQTPIIIFFLTAIGVFSSSQLKNSRKFATLIIFIIAAFASPPDIFSQVIIAIPMLLLFELSIWLSIIAGK